ncbi:MAG: IS110 family transposase, partial [Mesorhizobium sp.]
SQTTLGVWLRNLLARRHRNTVVVALANKLARIAWMILRHEVTFQANRATAMAA